MTISIGTLATIEDVVSRLEAYDDTATQSERILYALAQQGIEPNAETIDQVKKYLDRHDGFYLVRSKRTYRMRKAIVTEYELDDLAGDRYRIALDDQGGLVYQEPATISNATMKKIYNLIEGGQV
jgi:hypothetical protein